MIIMLNDQKIEIKGGTATGQVIHLGRHGAVELLEALARIHGFSLIDHVERKELVALAGEADEDDNQYDDATLAWSTWQDRCEALSSAVLSALSTQEV
jgi:hypothetical protein